MVAFLKLNHENKVIITKNAKLLTLHNEVFEVNFLKIKDNDKKIENINLIKSKLFSLFSELFCTNSLHAKTKD